MKAFVRYFTNRVEFAEAVAREVERVLAAQRRETCFTQHVEKTIRCTLDEEYEVFSLASPAKVAGVFDLSEMRGGDRVEIKVFAPVAGRPERVLEHWILDNFQKEPVFAMPMLVLPRGSRIVVQQTRGSSVVVGTEVFAFE